MIFLGFFLCNKELFLSLSKCYIYKYLYDALVYILLSQEKYFWKYRIILLISSLSNYTL